MIPASNGRVLPAVRLMAGEYGVSIDATRNSETLEAAPESPARAGRRPLPLSASDAGRPSRG